MPDMVRLAIERNLANAEKLGDADRVKRIQARIAQLEKPVKGGPVASSQEVLIHKDELITPVKPKPTVKKAKKATKATKSRKR